MWAFPRGALAARPAAHVAGRAGLAKRKHQVTSGVGGTRRGEA